MFKIIGNTTATTSPQPDWAQTDENKADYIKNKPDLSRIAGNYVLSAQNIGDGIIEILLTSMQSYGVTQSGHILTIIDGVPAIHSGSSLLIYNDATDQKHILTIVDAAHVARNGSALLIY